MTRTKYRLEPLAQARQVSVEKAARDLAEANAALSNAEQMRTRIEREAARATVEVALVRGEERTPGKPLSAADLVTYDAWEIRAEIERVTRERRLEAARAVESKEAHRAAAARALVEKRQAEARVVEKDRERFEMREAKQAEARQEVEANEAWRKRSE